MISRPLRALCARIVLPSLLLAAPTLAFAQTSESELAQLREQVRLLAEKVRELESRLAPASSAPAPATAPASTAASSTPSPKPAVLAVSDRSVTLTSGDGANSLRLRGLVQFDSRWFFDDGGISTNDAFVTRRARIIMEGQFNRIFQYQIAPDFAGSATTLTNANVSVNLSPAFQLKLGKFKVPIGFEQYQSNTVTTLVERSHPSSLMPTFDIGAQVGGELAEGKVTYSVGVFNGLADGASSTTNTDNDGRKAFAARVMVRPAAGLEVGVGGTYSPDLIATSGVTAGYRTDGQQRFFAYDAATVPEGDQWRLSPQATYTNGALGLLAEYAISSIEVRSGATTAQLKHDAWQLQAMYVLTGEKASFAGIVPRQNFSLTGAGKGAVSLAARLAGLDLDDATFPTFASGRTNATRVDSYGVGVNWYLSGSVKFMADLFQSDFDTALAPTSVLLRKGERSLLTRLQVSF